MSSLEEVKSKLDARGNMPQRDAMGHLYVEEMLRNAHFQGDISTNKEDLDSFSTDESIFSVRPQIVIAPRSKQDLEIAVKVIDLHTKTFPSLSLTTRGAGSGLSGGSLTDSIVVDTKHLCEIGEYNENDNTITVASGELFKNVEKILEKCGRYFPAAPSSKDFATVVGAVANNSAGPDSQNYGHMSTAVASMEVVLKDGNTYNIKPLTHDGFKALTARDNAYADITKAVYKLIKENQDEISKAKPKTERNTAGFPLWEVVTPSIKEFEAGRGTFDLTKIISGSQGTIGVITSVTLKTEPIKKETVLLNVPIFDLANAGKLITHVHKYKPLNIEIFDGTSLKTAMENPSFFRSRLPGFSFYRFLFSLYTTYLFFYRRNLPEFVVLITIDTNNTEYSANEIRKETAETVELPIKIINSKERRQMLTEVLRSSYELSKFADPTKRPAAFLEDMVVPPEHLSAFFTEIHKLLKKRNISTIVHGHGGGGHLHFYPLLDFREDQSLEVEIMAEEFFALALKYKGSICGEHNDGIIRTPHLPKLYSKKMISIFRKMEHIFDPKDIFNPGKKVNPRYDIKQYLRKTN